MTASLSWYIFITVLGWLSFPLAARLFRALPDRGYTLARAAGLLVWAYAFWIMGSFGFASNDLAGLLLALLVLLGLSAWALLRGGEDLWGWLRSNLRLIITSEVLFLAAFALMAYIRAANPEIYGTEKPMELAFIDSALRSPSFPPLDPWLSGYAISYYHFGYIITAMLARITSVPGTLAFNLMLALVFGMGAMGAYGIVYNLLALWQRSRGPDAERAPSAGLPLLAPLFLLVVSNAEGFLEVLHRLGLFWKFKADGTAVSGFWTWLDIKDLSQPPVLPLGWMPERYLWWWRASRVIQDYDLARNWKEIIDEFPAFSFLLGDLHPHVIAIPFGLLAVGFALNLYLGGWRGSFHLFGARIHIDPLGLFCAAFLLGSLAFLNVWDIVMAAGLIGMAYLLVRARDEGWNWGRLEDAVIFGVLLGAGAGVLYLPFFLSFSSQAGGMLPNLAYPTRGAHLWVMFAPLLVPVGAFLIYTLRHIRWDRWRLALGIALGVPLALWVLSWLLAWLVSILMPDFAGQILASQGMPDIGSYFAAATVRRIGSLGGVITLIALLFAAGMILIAPQRTEEEAEEDAQAGDPSAPDPIRFAGILIAVGGLLVLAPEFVYLRDQFGWRMNTIFKFYYQAWMLWSLAAAFGTAVLLRTLRGAADWGFRIALVLLLAVSLVYPVLAFPTKTSNFKPPFGFTLDDFDRVLRENPDEAGAIEYLRSAPEGVVAEAVGGSYTGFARISTYTGLPTVLGWPGHEIQWRGTAAPQGTRQDDIARLYTTNDWEAARLILEQYQVRYVIVGGLERQAYQVQEQKFRDHLRAVYQTGTISVYEVPQGQEN